MIEESVINTETIVVKIEYKGKTYSSTHKFTDVALQNGGRELLIQSASNAAMKAMREAIEAEQGVT